MEQLLIHGMWGLGDNIYQRPFVRQLARNFEIILETPWPEIYSDIGIKFVKGDRRLRTQLHNMARQDQTIWYEKPCVAHAISIKYGDSSFACGSIINAMERCFTTDFDVSLFNLPKQNDLLNKPKPYILVRPVTERKEWFNSARNPLPEYIFEIVEQLKDNYQIILIADLAHNEEWALPPLPFSHIQYLYGEISTRGLMELVLNAAAIIGPVGWIVPASLAANVPAFVVLGGQGAHNAPEKITDPRMDLSKIGFGVPDNLCMCNNMRHECIKTITSLNSQFKTWAFQNGILY